MRARTTPRFDRHYFDAPRAIRAAFDKQVAYLLANLHHPSLRAKKYNKAEDIWQARVTGSWRFYFKIESDAYVILDIIPHPK